MARTRNVDPELRVSQLPNDKIDRDRTDLGDTWAMDGIALSSAQLFWVLKAIKKLDENIKVSLDPSYVELAEFGEKPSNSVIIYRDSDQMIMGAVGYEPDYDGDCNGDKKYFIKSRHINNKMFRQNSDRYFTKKSKNSEAILKQCAAFFRKELPEERFKIYGGAAKTASQDAVNTITDLRKLNSNPNQLLGDWLQKIYGQSYAYEHIYDTTAKMGRDKYLKVRANLLNIIETFKEHDNPLLTEFIPAAEAHMEFCDRRFQLIDLDFVIPKKDENGEYVSVEIANLAKDNPRLKCYSQFSSWNYTFDLTKQEWATKLIADIPVEYTKKIATLQSLKHYDYIIGVGTAMIDDGFFIETVKEY